MSSTNVYTCLVMGAAIVVALAKWRHGSADDDKIDGIPLIDKYLELMNRERGYSTFPSAGLRVFIPAEKKPAKISKPVDVPD